MVPGQWYCRRELAVRLVGNDMYAFDCLVTLSFMFSAFLVGFVFGMRFIVLVDASIMR